MRGLPSSGSRRTLPGHRQARDTPDPDPDVDDQGQVMSIQEQPLQQQIPAQAVAPDRPGPQTAGTTELRLALVCYGGVSLAIYMHGVTKELHKLVRASRRFDEGEPDAENPFREGSDTEWAYFEALRELAVRGRRLSVSIDVIAGTSAGGINGVVLGKVLALDAEQEALRKLWIDEGDLKKLLRALPIGGWRIRAALAGVRQLLHLTSATSPLKGERMSKLLLQAIGDMDKGRPTSTLLPQNGSLELLVTATDLHGFEVLVPTGTGGASQRDRQHAQVLRFEATPSDVDEFAAAGTPALAFAARATSSFPGAFAPVSLHSFGQETGHPIDPVDITDRFRYCYEENGFSATDAWFVDGGVLDNAPFDLVIDAISNKRAETEVDRRIVYLQPDPGRPLGAQPGADDRPPNGPPSWLGGLWGSVAGAKGSHSVVRELRNLQEMNVHIAEIGAITEGQRHHVTAEVEAILDEMGGQEPGYFAWNLESRDAVADLTERMRARSQELLGVGFPTYCWLKVESAGRRFADEMAHSLVIPPDSSRSSFLRAAIGAWARRQDAWSDPQPGVLASLLGPVDVPYRERRLMFLLAGLNGMFEQARRDPELPRTDLVRLKDEAWHLLEQLREVPRRTVAEVPDALRSFLAAARLDERLLGRPDDFARDHDEEFATLFRYYRDALERQLGEGSVPLWRAFQEVTRAWPAKYRRELLTYYLGFPLWDGLIFPTVALARLPQYSPIAVSQFSPLLAGALVPPDFAERDTAGDPSDTAGAAKLKGNAMAHFSAFLKAEWRENDYLWGRLDATELILRMLYESSDPSAPDPVKGVAPASVDEAVATAGGDRLLGALRAVLSSESGLKRVTKLREGLRGQLQPAHEIQLPG